MTREKIFRKEVTKKRNREKGEINRETNEKGKTQGNLAYDSSQLQSEKRDQEYTRGEKGS